MIGKREFVMGPAPQGHSGEAVGKFLDEKYFMIQSMCVKEILW
jgi:hypothetical protein